jgi:creatinine amidohydrolase
MRPYVLAETNYTYTKAHSFEVAVLPLGATEPHNLHLPYGTDLFESTVIGQHICAEAHRHGAKVTLLPAIPFGTETNLSKFPLAINLNPSTLLQVIRDIADSLEHSKVRKLLLLNSHGGNEFKPVLRELAHHPVKLFLCDWFRMVKDVTPHIFKCPDDHAGEMETSLALAYFPEFVLHNESGRLAADDGKVNVTRFDAVNQGFVSISRPWHLLTTNTGSGNPHFATKEKGEQLMQIIVERLSSFLVELSDAKLDESFPF